MRLNVTFYYAAEATDAEIGPGKRPHFWYLVLFSTYPLGTSMVKYTSVAQETSRYS